MSNTVKITVPDLGDFRDVPIVEIPVSVGDVIAAGDTIVVVESDKATLDVPAEVGGRIAALHVNMGDKVSEGVLLVEIEAGEAAQDGPAAEPAPVPVAAAPARAAAARRRAGRLGPCARGSCVRWFAAARLALDPQACPRAGRRSGAHRGQRTQRQDHSRGRAGLRQGGAASANSCKRGRRLGLPDWPRVDFAKFGEIERKPLSRIVRISGPALARNTIMIPHVINFDEADVTELEAFRKTANADKDTPSFRSCPSSSRRRWRR